MEDWLTEPVVFTRLHAILFNILILRIAVFGMEPSPMKALRQLFATPERSPNE